jgi:hypothetical protein
VEAEYATKVVVAAEAIVKSDRSDPGFVVKATIIVDTSDIATAVAIAYSWDAECIVKNIATAATTDNSDIKCVVKVTVDDLDTTAQKIV